MQELENALSLPEINKPEMFSECENDEVILLSKCLAKMYVEDEMGRAEVYKLLIKQGTEYIQRKESAMKFLQERGGGIPLMIRKQKRIKLSSYPFAVYSNYMY